ncbi:MULTISPECIES: peptidoglycan-binding protein [unclassified Streptomyces]|uniref:peptidoglycan-binding protein n=1 Tax=unclassified Streptomyces TaxID=2593676 RepID=UPI0033AC1254
MTVPVFEEYAPAVDCGCTGCAQGRRTAAALPVRYGGHPAAHGARRALVLVTAAGVVLSCGADQAAAAAAGPRALADTSADPQPVTPQGTVGPLNSGGASGPPSAPSTAQRTTTRADIINRAKKWVTAKVPYDMAAYWSDGYRQDCSGFVSMAWNLGGNEWTGSLAAHGTKIARADLQPGDILLFHNPADPSAGSHVTVFGGWSDHTHSHYLAYELTRPHARKATTPMAYWSNSSKYVAYRYKGVVSGASGSGSATAFPGAGKFGPGANNAHVTRLGKLLIAQGGKRFYKEGAGPRWSDADKRATQAFQLAQGWKGKEADGVPGPHTWRLLVDGTGRKIPAAGAGGSPSTTEAYPGPSSFRPGRSNGHVLALGTQLVKKGYGKHYVTGPGRSWTEADRRNVEAFQRAQGWSGGAADGYPGPETWRRLFA